MARKSVQSLMQEMERHGLRMQRDGRLQVSGEAPAALLLRAHRNRRALLAALGGQQG